MLDEHRAEIDSTRAGEQGASLVELVVGTVLIATVLGPAITLSLTHSRLRTLDGEVALAFAACRNAIEQVRAMTFADVPTLDGRGFSVPGPDGSANGLSARAGDSDGMPGRFTVTVDRSFGGEVLYRVHVAVAWTGCAGEQERHLETLIANRSPL